MAFTASRMATARSRGHRDDDFLCAGIQQMAFWLQPSADSAAWGKRVASGSTVYSAPSLSQALTTCNTGLCAWGLVFGTNCAVGRFCPFIFQMKKPRL